MFKCEQIGNVSMELFVHQRRLKAQQICVDRGESVTFTFQPLLVCNNRGGIGGFA
jgi:hypothetical protein